jgi:predicted 2-oxoglutarate/Fe(II)-dependent dioxygenase YbiX
MIRPTAGGAMFSVSEDQYSERDLSQPAQAGNGDEELLVLPSFAPPNRCAELVSAFDQAVSVTGRSGDVRVMPIRTEVAGRVFGLCGMAEIHQWLSETRLHALDAVRRFFNIEGQLFVDFTLVSEMREGDSHPLHADNEREDEGGQWVPNHTPWRDHTAMLYLNSSGIDYQGGLLRFPLLARDIAPQAGQLVGFSCRHQHQHEVTAVQGGRRYSVSMWLTSDPEFAEEWE